MFKKFLWLLILFISLPIYSRIIATKTTDIILVLDRDPHYEMGLTLTPIDDYTEIAGVYNIQMSEINSILTLDKAYYISYRFTEFDSVKLTLSLSGDLKLLDKKSEWNSTELIPYTLSLYKKDNTLLTEINSSNTEEIVILDTRDLTEEGISNGYATSVGKMIEDSYKIDISSNVESTQYQMGEFKGSISLNLKSN